jgi:RNA polymerase-associated protein LEO1
MLAQAEQDQEALRKKVPKSTRPGVGGSASARRRRKVTASERRRRGGYSDDEDSADAYEDDIPRRRGAEEPEGRNAKGNEDYLEDEFLVADSDEDFDTGTSRKKSKRVVKESAEGAVDEMDALDEMEQKIERSLAGAKKDSGGGDDMDLDDEEEEGNAIQKSFGKRRKHMVADSDEE